MRLETSRLVIRPLTLDDAPDVLALLNEPSFLAFVGDRGVRTLDDARRYLETGPLAMYAAHGHGMYHVSIKAGGAMAGICGLMHRDALPHPDLGFALFPACWRQGYAFEASTRVLEFARESLGLGTLLAVVQHDNVVSQRLLRRLGFRDAGTARLPGGSVPLLLFTTAPIETAEGRPDGGLAIGAG